MKKKTKEIIETTTLAVGVILLSAAAFYSSKETGKTELKTDRKEQITSEQETKEAYEAAQKELSFGTAMQTAGIILNSVQWIIMPKPVSQWGSVM